MKIFEIIVLLILPIFNFCGSIVEVRGSTAEDYSFIVMGDIPYSDGEMRRFSRLITKINNLPVSPRFVVHVGDLEDGTDCRESRLVAVRTQLERLHSPWSYTPGDNDWIDCADDNYENVYPHLFEIRSVFFLDKNANINFHKLENWKRQGSVIENQLWTSHRSVFITTDLVTWGADYAGIHRKDGPVIHEFTARGEAASLWVDRASHVPILSQFVVVFGQVGVPGCESDDDKGNCGPNEEDANHTPGISALNSGGGFFADFNQVAKGDQAHQYLYIHGDNHKFFPPHQMFSSKNGGFTNLFSMQVPGSPDVSAVIVTIHNGDLVPTQFGLQRINCPDKCSIELIR